jgi:tRNA threonylcarbamoyladenosine biosynthesis protein TsaB
MQLLAIETSETACSAAVWSDGAVIESYREEPRGHSELLLPMIAELLASSGVSRRQLQAVAFGRGPGSFTGVRIAAAIAQGICLGLAIPAIPVSSLRALAQGVYRTTGQRQAAAAFDARMHEVYWALCAVDDDGVMQLQSEERVCAPQQVELPQQGQWAGAGSGWGAYGATLRQQLAPWLAAELPQFCSHAQDVATIAAHDWSRDHGVAVGAAEALPIYLRDKVAQKKAQQPAV